MARLQREAEWREGIGSRLAHASAESAWVAGSARGIVLFEDDAPAAGGPVAPHKAIVALGVVG